MNSSFPNRWSFSYLKFTKYVTNIIVEPKYKYRHQEQVTVRNPTEVPPRNSQYKNTGGLKPVLRVPNLALSFYHGSKHSCSVRVVFSSMDHHVKQINVEQHHWNTGAKENQQLNPGEPSNRQKTPAQTN